MDDSSVKEVQDNGTGTEPTKIKSKSNTNLFDYTEEELLTDQSLTHYEILNIPEHATPDQVKKAYRKSSLKYHPDKTGRGENDYVFLAVKAAYDTLLDPAKRQGYDSTVLPFDDSIPSQRAVLLQDSLVVYTDDDFYETFGTVFQRNLRFDARLRPDAGNPKKNSSQNNNSSGNSNNKNNKNNNNKGGPPSMGDSNTLLEQVNSFYEYWIHFESWRDFSAQAADELQVENELENAESRFEKRWIQKEIDRRARQLKRTEMARIQTLVERAMEADPRLRWHRQSLIQAREQAAADRLRAKEEELQAAEEAAQHAEALLVHEQELRAAEKIQRDLEKKRLRKARQTLRKMTSSSFESYTTETTTNGSNGVVGDDSEGVGGGEANGTSGSRSSNCGKANKNSNNENQKDSNIHGSPPPPLWNDAYDLSQDVEFLCTSLSLDELNQLNEDFERINNAKGLSLIHQLTLERKAQEQLQQKQQSQSQRVSPVDSDSNNKPAPWTALELSALAKAVKKYPAGGASRWDAIALLVNSMCRPDVPRTREACIEKFNQIIRSSSSAKNSTVSAAAAVAAQNAATIAAPLDKTTIDPCESVSASTSSNGFSSKSTTLLDVATTEDSATACKDAVLDDTMETKWTPKQDQQLQEALSKFPNSMEKNERWTSIAAVVSGQTKKACVQRFKAIRETLLKQKSGPSI